MIRIDASLIDSHSDKERAAGTFKGGWGFHPLLAFCDNTGELLAVIARTGSAGSNTAVDHIAIIDAAIAAVPARWRRNIMVTIDGAGSSHKVVEHLTALNSRPGWSVAYSVGFDLDERVRTAIAATPEHVWEAALDAAGKAREDAQVAEVTGLLRDSCGGDRLKTWPAGMRILVRREEIETGAQLSLFEQANGYRYQPLATATAGGQVQRIEARHRVHARVEGIHPLRQGHWAGQMAVVVVRDQHRVGDRGRHRDRPAVLDAAAAARRAAGQSRTGHASLPAATRRRPPGVPFPHADPPDPRNLALGTRFQRRVRPRPRDPLTTGPCPTDPERSNRHRDRGTRRHRTTRGAAAYPLPQNQDRNGRSAPVTGPPGPP